MQQAMEYIDYTDQVQVDYSHLQKSKLKFKKGQRAKSVYHYTSIGGLESILRNKTLRFTNIKYMNDKDEITAFEMRHTNNCACALRISQSVVLWDTPINFFRRVNALGDFPIRAGDGE